MTVLAGSPPVVTVVIPTYNAAATIADQLRALERQQMSDEWEIVVALQPCTDDTAAVIAACASERVRVVEAFERRGASYARNAGAAAALAPLVAFCDADDIVADDWLVELLRQGTSPAVAGAAVPFNNPSRLAEVDRETAVVPGNDFDFWQSAYSNNMLVHRSAFNAIGGFDLDLSYCEDTDLAWRMQLAGYEITTAPKAVVYYRQRSTSRGRWLQVHRWCRTGPTLYRRYRAHGMQRSDPRRAALDWLWLVTRLPLIVRPSHRSVWLRRSARRTGYLLGSVRERCIFL